MAHPNGQGIFQAAEESVVGVDLNFRRAVLAVRRFFDPAAEMLSHQLHAVTNPQNGKTQVPNSLIGTRGVGLIHAGGAAGEYQPRGLAFADLLQRVRKGRISQYTLASRTRRAIN